MKAALVTPRRKTYHRAAAARKPRRSGTLTRFLAGCLVLSLGIILAYHFFLFWTTGSVIIEEPNRPILCLESMLSLGIIAFGLERLIHS
jgi:hypothetical protein